MEQFLNYFIPKNYKLDLYIDKDADIVDGRVIITGTPKSQQFFLHAVNMDIESVKINTEAAEFSYNNEKITFNHAPVEQEIAIDVCFHEKLNKNMQGTYLSTYEYESHVEKIVSTQFESHYAREAFPCIDEPAAKATFELSIALPKKSTDIVIANTPILKVEQNRTYFEITPRMSTYLLAFVIGQFHSKSITNAHGVKITTYAPLNQPVESVEFANEVAAKSLEFYDDKFAIKYPLKKLDQVAIPDFEAGAMENWGLVTYRESMLLADKTITKDTKKSIALTVAHELSHQWFGNLVTMRWWDDLWLNESFASVIEYIAVDNIYKDFNIWEDFFTGDCMAALNRDLYSGVQSVYQPVSTPAEIATLFDGAIVYAKGARLMLMLIRLMGEDKFFAGIRDYFQKYSYQNTCGDDLWNALNPYADFEVKEFMHAWISQSGYPVITKGKQKRFLLDGKSDNTSWPLPKIVDDMSGHYLINLDQAEFEQKLSHFDELNLEQRLRLLTDRMLLAKTDAVSSDSLLDLLPKFKDETSASVWEIIVRIVAHLKLFFTPKTDEEKRFKQYVLELITPQLQRLGLEPKENESDEDLRLRNMILGLDYYASDMPNIEKLAQKYCEDFSTLHPEIRNDVLDAKMRVDESIFDEYLKKYQEITDPEVKDELRYSLSLARDEKNIDKLIELLKKPDIIKPQDHLHMFIYLCRNYRATDKVFDWLFANWDYVVTMTGEKSLEDYPRYMAGVIKTREKADRFYAFFEKYKEHPVLSRTLTVARNEIESRIKLVEQDQASVYKKLK